MFQIFLTEISTFFEILLFGAIILFAFLAVTAKKLAYAAGYFCIMSILLGALFLILSAPIVAAFQFIIYAGTMTILSLVVISLTRGHEE